LDACNAMHTRSAPSCRAAPSCWATQGLPTALLDFLLDLPEGGRTKLLGTLRQVCRQWRQDVAPQVSA